MTRWPGTGACRRSRFAAKASARSSRKAAILLISRQLAARVFARVLAPFGKGLDGVLRYGRADLDIDHRHFDMEFAQGRFDARGGLLGFALVLGRAGRFRLQEFDGGQGPQAG